MSKSNKQEAGSMGNDKGGGKKHTYIKLRIAQKGKHLRMILMIFITEPTTSTHDGGLKYLKKASSGLHAYFVFVILLLLEDI